jgi:predicted nucleic acid-binding Zn ribbon protein
MMVRRRTPRPLGEVLDAVVDRVEPATTLAMVQRAWAGAVGEAIASRASPVSERDGVVTVACESSIWAQELDLLGGQILEQLRAELADEAALRGLRFSSGAELG